MVTGDRGTCYLPGWRNGQIFVPDVQIGLDVAPNSRKGCSCRRIKSLEEVSLIMDNLQQIKSIWQSKRFPLRALRERQARRSRTVFGSRLPVFPYWRTKALLLEEHESVVQIEGQGIQVIIFIIYRTFLRSLGFRPSRNQKTSLWKNMAWTLLLPT